VARKSNGSPAGFFQPEPARTIRMRACARGRISRLRCFPLVNVGKPREIGNGNVARRRRKIDERGYRCDKLRTHRLMGRRVKTMTARLRLELALPMQDRFLFRGTLATKQNQHASLLARDARNNFRPDYARSRDNAGQRGRERTTRVEAVPGRCILVTRNEIRPMSCL